jgi:hypothetical protein
MANSCAEKYTQKIVSDYKLVDSIKQECIRLKWAKRFEPKFVEARTGHRPPPGDWKPPSGVHQKVNSTIINPPNATNITETGFTLRIYYKKFWGPSPRGGGPCGFIISFILIILYRIYKANKRKNYRGLF